MRISDWSSDVCSSDLIDAARQGRPDQLKPRRTRQVIERSIFSEEHEMWRESVRKFVEREIVPYHDEWGKEGIVPLELWLKAGAEGMLCSTVRSEEHTSELQSLMRTSYDDFCLNEKKDNNNE